MKGEKGTNAGEPYYKSQWLPCMRVAWRLAAFNHPQQHSSAGSPPLVTLGAS